MQNYFSVFDLTPSFTLNVEALEKHYFTAQRTYHPDRLLHKSAAEKQKAILHSMLINEAYEALKSPLKRAQHLLALQGITVGSEADSVKPDMALLTEIMESREALAEAETAEAVAAIEAANAQEKARVRAMLTGLFDANQLQQAASATIKLGYLYKMDDELRIKRKMLAL